MLKKGRQRECSGTSCALQSSSFGVDSKGKVCVFYDSLWTVVGDIASDDKGFELYGC